MFPGSGGLLGGDEVGVVEMQQLGDAADEEISTIEKHAAR